MSIPAHLARLQHLTGRLTPSSSAPADELARFERTLARHLRDHPDLTISGNRLPHEGADALEAESDAFTRRIRNLEAELTGQPSEPAAAAPLVFRRETAFRSALLGNSVPEWGAGMAPAASYGPFLDDNGLHVWFDLFQPTRLVSVLFAGSATPVLRVPIWGTITGRQSYRIEAGSAWIASARHRAGGGARGLLHRSQDHGRVARSLAGRHRVRGQHRHPGVGHRRAPSGPGSDRRAAHRPGGGHRRGGGGRPPAGALRSRASASCQPRPGRGRLVHGVRLPGRLPAVRAGADLASAHQSGPGALRGRHAHERAGSLRDRHVEVGALHGGRPRADRSRHDRMAPARREGRPAGARRRGGRRRPLRDRAEGALHDVAGSHARQDHAPSSGRDRGARPGDADRLHRLERATAGSDGRCGATATTRGIDRPSCSRSASCSRSCSSPSAANSEGVFFFCGDKAEIDRPVDANGKPFPIRSAVAFAATLQIGETFHAVLLDNDLLDAQLGNPHGGPAVLPRAQERPVHRDRAPQPRRSSAILENGRHHQRPSRADARHPSLSADAPGSLRRLVHGLPARAGGGRVRGRPAGAHRLRQVARPVAASPTMRPIPRTRARSSTSSSRRPRPRSAGPSRRRHRSFRTGVATFEQDLPARAVAETTLLHRAAARRRPRPATRGAGGASG